MIFRFYISRDFDLNSQETNEISKPLNMVLRDSPTLVAVVTFQQDYHPFICKRVTIRFGQEREERKAVSETTEKQSTTPFDTKID